MRTWAQFVAASPEIGNAVVRLLATEEVAFLATTSATGRPRIHPFVPRVVEGRLLAFVLDTSPKRRDLDDRGQFGLHASLGPEDEEVYLSGAAVFCDDDAHLRSAADVAMGFVTGPADDHHLLYEFTFDKAMWTTWLDFGTPNHRPNRVIWNE